MTTLLVWARRMRITTISLYSQFRGVNVWENKIRYMLWKGIIKPDRTTRHLSIRANTWYINYKWHATFFHVMFILNRLEQAITQSMHQPLSCIEWQLDWWSQNTWTRTILVGGYVRIVWSSRLNTLIGCSDQTSFGERSLRSIRSHKEGSVVVWPLDSSGHSQADHLKSDTHGGGVGVE